MVTFKGGWGKLYYTQHTLLSNVGQIFSSNLNHILAWKTLKFGFLYFWKSCRELNLISKITNPESIGILNRKLEPKY